jgi:hypothetical protein
LLLQKPQDLACLAFIAQQDLRVRKRFLVQLELGLQLLIFSLQLSAIPALLVVFVMRDLPLLCVAQQARFVTFRVQRDLLSVLNVPVASVVASVPSIRHLVLLDFILILEVQIVSFAHLDFSVRTSRPQDR